MRYFPPVRPFLWAVFCCAAMMLGLAAKANADGAANYEKAGDLSGTLTSIGSDTLLNVMTFWAEDFKKMYPNVTFQIEGKGSATAPPALTEGKSLLGPMSRKMKPEEIDAFEAKRGFKPTRYDVALDCLAVYVNKDNPVKGFTMAQLDCIFSKTRKSGFADITTWGQAGLTDPAWADQPISLYGRNSASGTYAYFKEHALLKGDYKDSVKEQPGSSAVVGGVAKDRQGIGYSGIGYKTSEVRALPLAKTENDKLVEPTFENAISGAYPLGRTLYIYVAQKPGEPMPPLVKEFLKFVLSKQGQAIVVKDGYGELPEKMIAKNVKQLDEGMPKPSQAALRKVKRHDLLARWVVTFGGVVVIVSVLGILIMILGTTLPLFLPARTRLLAQAPLPPSVAAEGVLGLGIEVAADDHWRVVQVVDASGMFHFVDLATGKVVQELPAQTAADDPRPERNGKGLDRARRKLLSADSSGPASYTLRWSDGSISLVDVAAVDGKQPDRAFPQFALKVRAEIPTDKLGPPAIAIVQSTGEKSSACASLYDGNRIVVIRRSVTKNEITDEETASSSRLTLGDDVPGRVTAMAMDHAGNTLYAGTANGSLLWWRLGDDRVIEHDIVPAFVDKRAVTCMRLLLGDVTLVVGDAQGRVSNWFFVRPEFDRAAAALRPGSSSKSPAARREVKKLTLVRSLQPHAARIDDIAASPRNRSLLVRDASGVATMDYTTSQRRLATLEGVKRFAFSSRGDVVATLAGDRLQAWRVEGSLFGLGSAPLHPEVSWLSLCGRVWYEGHDAPEFSWQSTGGADDYEPKLSLVPLVFGTLKGTFYAMLLAGPLGLGAAIYVSHFSSPGLRAWVKPAIEMMACVPSVVLGFIVGIWLAPVIKDGLVALLLSALSIPLVFIAFLLIWQQVYRSPAAQRRLRSREFLLAGLLLAVGVAAAAWFSSPIEQRLFGGNVTVWLSKSLGMIYDQRNSVLIAFGVGFMVVPIIFTLAEDALSAVPHSMTAASMALGASRWQTVWRVVLPSASPGIFAAVMIGFGRAVGETMVFLMATGNSALMDWSPFNGMRTLSANIAQEFPEAAVGGTLYRVLFLCAVVLFVLTFVLNTAAEVVRQQLRKRYGQF